MTTSSSEAWREDYDWKEVFGYVGEPDTGAADQGSSCKARWIAKGPAEDRGVAFPISSVVEPLAMVAGDNDAETWLGLFKVRHSSVYGEAYLFVEAGCDYTGWDCQASGYGYASLSLENLWRWGVGDEQRARLVAAGLAMEEVCAD
jgi:hypothetical protein